MSQKIPKVGRVLKKIWIFLAILIIFIAVVFSIVRSLTPWIKEYKGDVEHHLSLLTGQPVSIQNMETGWYWLQPVLRLNQVTFGDDTKNKFSIKKLLVGINLFKSFWNWQIQPGVLYIDQMHLILREKDGHWTINGITTNLLNNKEMIPEKTKKILLWLSHQEHLIIKEVSAFFYLSNGGVIPINIINLSIANNSGHYKFRGEAKLEQTSTTSFQLLGNGYFNPNNFKNIEGQFYFSAKNIIPAQWQSMFPETKQLLEGGKGNVSLWLDVRHGAISSVQAQVQLKRLAWKLMTNQQSQLIQSFFANISWKPNKEGWELNADKIQLRIGGLLWPENQLSLKYNNAQQSYRLFIKSLIIESLLSNAINWPNSVRVLLNMKPEGILRDTQILISFNSSSIPPIPILSKKDSDKQIDSKLSREQINLRLVPNDFSIDYILTRFEQLKWKPINTIPEVENLSGVIHWQPEQGRLELDSENISIKIKDYPKQTLDLLNGAVDWKELNDGLRISLDRLLINQPELTLSLQGVIDQVTSQSVGHMRLGAEFSGKNWQQWIPFLPEKYLKPKLYLWLTKDVKSIAEASGRIRVNGLAKDFPFDNQLGEFIIESYASGAEIAINSKWQVVKEIDGYIHLKNRNLNMDIVHANFQGVETKQINLRIDDIGKDRENLIATGEINAPMQKMINYIIDSPLKKKLPILKLLSAKGFALLQFYVKAPLYPENNTVLANGSLIFDNNLIKINKYLGLEELNGKLMFDETGVKDSVLDGKVFGNAMNIHINSTKAPQSTTIMTMKGTWNAKSLKNQLASPLLDFFDGSFVLQALLRISAKPSAPSSLTLSSTLEGLSINLPQPFGKSANMQAPTELNFELKSPELIRLKGNYDNRLSAEFLYKNKIKDFSFESGQIFLGSGNAVNQNQPGLSIVGKLQELNLKELKSFYEQFSGQKQENSFMNKLRRVNLTIDKFNFMKQQFDSIRLKAKVAANKDWIFNLNQKNISADLSYHVPTNEVSGHVQHLHLEKIVTTGKSSLEILHPNQIPNLNLRVDNLSVDKVQIGDVTLKSKSTANQWLINYCQINSPVYQINVQGNWMQQERSNNTNLNLNLNTNSLEQTLERWNITPVVHAKKGYMEFHGGWSNSIDKFSLAALNGKIFLQFKNGRITHLSKEAEEKLDLGKLLSILSLQTIPRRLQLDFSDLANQGYSFDIFQGNFLVKKGILSTQDSYLDGPVAYADMKGDLDLVKHIYDLNLEIAPHITASLPIVATIAGGPVAGIAVWVANKIITQGVQKISSYSYKISGPWNDPVIQQLNIVKQNTKKMQNSKIKKKH